MFRLTLFTSLVLISANLSAQQFVSTGATDNDKVHEHQPGDHVRRSSPDWSAKDASGKMIRGREFLGKPTVLIFYFGESCVHCNEQLNLFAKRVNDFQQAGVTICSVSAATLESDSSLPFPLLSDPSHRSFKDFRAYDLYNEKPLHGTFLLDAGGNIRWQNIGVHPFVNVSLLLAEAAKIQQQEDEVERPKVFLDKSPRIVAYQLGRLNNEKLLLVERATTDKKYVPVYSAILARDGMSPQYREEALAALVVLNESNNALELLNVIGDIKTDSRQGKQTARELAAMLLKLNPTELDSQIDQFVEATENESDLLRQVGFACLNVAGKSELAWKQAAANKQASLSWLESISLIPGDKIRNSLRTNVLSLLGGEDDAVVSAAIQSLRFIPEKQDDTFLRMVKFLDNPKVRPAAVQTMLQVPDDQRNETTSQRLVDYFVELAENTEAENRTSDDFLDAMQLVDQLMVSLPIDQAKLYRARLNEVTVRVVKITTIEDEMRYDIPFFAVEAGRPVQIILENHDLMAHNLVITKAGAMKSVAEIGGAAGPAKDYLPEDKDDILFATKMIQSNQRDRLTFDAPTEPGEYPYVCTFPQHWSRMYGVMVVVEDLDAWMKSPTKPKDPIGNTRSFVKSWSVDELAPELEAGIRGRSQDIGARIYKEATCLQCHQLGGDGGKVGPALDEVFAKHKNDREVVLREILEPSHRIDEKYSMHKILTIDGLTITGIIQSENDEEITLLDNPESTELTKVLVDDIEEMVKTSKSIMPKALLDNFTKDEIFELYSYLESMQKK